VLTCRNLRVVAVGSLGGDYGPASDISTSSLAEVLAFRVLGIGVLRPWPMRPALDITSRLQPPQASLIKTGAVTPGSIMKTTSPPVFPIMNILPSQIYHELRNEAALASGRSLGRRQTKPGLLQRIRRRTWIARILTRGPCRGRHQAASPIMLKHHHHTLPDHQSAPQPRALWQAPHLFNHPWTHVLGT
jgi:hypothetical protein